MRVLTALIALFVSIPFGQGIKRLQDDSNVICRTPEVEPSTVEVDLFVRAITNTGWTMVPKDQNHPENTRFTFMLLATGLGTANTTVTEQTGSHAATKDAASGASDSVMTMAMDSNSGDFDTTFFDGNSVLDVLIDSVRFREAGFSKPIVYAARGYLSLLQELPVDEAIHAVDSRNRTACWWASWHDQYECAQYLIESGDYYF